MSDTPLADGSIADPVCDRGQFAKEVEMETEGGTNMASETVAPGSNMDAEGSNEDESDEEEVVDLAAIKLLDEKIKSSPYNYQAHVDRINLLRKCGEFQSLSAARHEMKKLFPLTKQLWLEWLEDEQKFVESEDDHAKLEELFELSVQDYLAPDIWLEYIQYSIRNIGTESGVKKLRGLLERALSSVGLHVLNGSTVWEAYREIENAVLVTMQPLPGSITTPEQNDRIVQQTTKVGLLFSRQLAVPLLNMELTMLEYEEWWKVNGDGEIPQSVLQSYNKALEQLEELKLLEIAMESAEAPKRAEYAAYIEHEKKSNNPARMQCIYERAITDDCLNAQLWIDYLKYLTSTLKSGPILLATYERSVRNCPWVGQLWIGLLVTLERNNAPIEKLEPVLNESLAVGFSSASEYVELWKAWCNHIRRRYADSEDRAMSLAAIRSAFNRATSHLTNNVLTEFGEMGDPDYSLWVYWAQLEAGLSPSGIDGARKIMGEVMGISPDVKLNWNIWLEFYHLERMYGDLSHARDLLRRAAQSCAVDDGSAESACKFLLRFDSEHGSLSDLDESSRKVEARMAKVNKRREKVAAQAEERTKKQSAKKGDKNRKHQQPSPHKKEDQRRPNKRSISNKESPENPKRQKIESPVTDSFKAPAGLPPRFVAAKSPEKPLAPPPGYKPEAQEKKIDSKDNTSKPASEAVKSAPVDDRIPEGDKHTVFVSNMSYGVEDPESKLKTMFGCCGDVVSVRVVRDHKAKMRGFAFVTFQETDHVEKALKLDRQPLEGRPLYVSRNTEKSNRTKVFKYDTGIEKHKLFVSSLNFKTTEETLSKVFAEHGKLKSVRIVITREGKSKGIAFIEYENETDAAQAVIKTDQSEIDGFTIKVAISNPPARGRPGAGGKSLGVGDRSTGANPGSRGKGKSQVTLLPRAVRGAKGEEKGKKDANDNSIPPKGMTNQDFASLYVKP